MAVSLSLLVFPCVFLSPVFPCLSLCLLVCVLMCVFQRRGSPLLARPSAITTHSSRLHSCFPYTHQFNSTSTLALHPFITRSLFLTLALGHSVIVCSDLSLMLILPFAYTIKLHSVICLSACPPACQSFLSPSLPLAMLASLAPHMECTQDPRYDSFYFTGCVTSKTC